MGGVEMQRGNLEAARLWIQRGLDTAIAAQDDYNTIGAYYTRGWLEILCGDRAAARADFNAALDHVMDSDVLSGGECPTFFVDEGTGDVTVRGFDPNDRTRELDVEIPAATWAHLLSQLPR